MTTIRTRSTRLATAPCMAVLTLVACHATKEHAPTIATDRIDAAADTGHVADAGATDARVDGEGAHDAYVLEKDPEFLCRPFCVPSCPASTVTSTTVPLAKTRADETIRYPRPALADASAAKAVDRGIGTRLDAERVRYEHLSCANATGKCERSLDIECAPAFVSNDFVSIGCLELIELGGAHPTKDVLTLNFAIAKGAANPVRIEDFFDPKSAWRPELLRRFDDALRARMDRFFGADMPLETVKAVGPFVVSCRGLHLVDTELPFAIGPLDALVPWSELGPWLAAAGPVTALR